MTKTAIQGQKLFVNLHLESDLISFATLLILTVFSITEDNLRTPLNVPLFSSLKWGDLGFNVTSQKAC